MNQESRLWLVRHAPVDGPVGVIHAPDAPADLGNTSRLQALRAQLPAACAAYCSPARRTVETAAALHLDPITEPSFREQGFGAWTGRRHGEIEDPSRPAAAPQPPHEACSEGLRELHQ